MKCFLFILYKDPSQFGSIDVRGKILSDYRSNNSQNNQKGKNISIKGSKNIKRVNKSSPANAKEQIGIKGRKNIKRANKSSPLKAAKKIWRDLPLHPSLDGFELHRDRGGKSVESESMTTTNSTSEVISIVKMTSLNNNESVEEKEAHDNVPSIATQDVGQKNVETM